MLENLPDISEEDTRPVGNIDRGIPDDKYQKFIRNNAPQSNPYTNASGMNLYNEAPGGQQQAQMQAQVQQPPQQLPPPQPYHNCIDIANHIQGCPICSKFYNADRTLYIVIICILAVVCLLLLKRVLNV